MSARTRVVLSSAIAAVLTAACDGNRSVSNDRALVAQKASFAAEAVPLAASAALADTAVAAGFVGEAQRSRFATARGVPVRQARADTNQTNAQATRKEVVPGSMLVRTGKASLLVDSLEVSIARVRDVARRTGAVIANTSMDGGREQTRAASLELRIPSERFDDAVNGLSPIGKLESVNVSVQDVGDEFVDVQARMFNAHRLEQRLIELLANRTGKLSDVLTVEGELARVREEIERYDGRLRYLRARSLVSTLVVAVHEKFPIVADAGTHPFRDAFAQAGRSLVSITAGMIASLGVLVPIGVILGVILLIGRRFFATHGLRLPEKTTERA